MLPLNIIKNIGVSSSDSIIKDREINGKFSDFFNFISRCYGFCVNKKILESLIFAGVLDSFNVNRKTMLENIDNAVDYAELIHDLDESLVEKPVIKKYEEFDEVKLRDEEVNLYGFHITNHPASNFMNIIKMSNIVNYFDKVVKCVVLVENIKLIDTKNNKKMAFVTGSDETGYCDFIIFPNNYELMKYCGVNGDPEKREDVIEGAKKLLDFGFANFTFRDIKADIKNGFSVEIKDGVKDSVRVKADGGFGLLLKKSDDSKITQLLDWLEHQMTRDDILIP